MDPLQVRSTLCKKVLVKPSPARHNQQLLNLPSDRPHLGEQHQQEALGWVVAHRARRANHQAGVHGSLACRSLPLLPVHPLRLLDHKA